MRWPWQRAEQREGDTATTYTALVARLIQSQADGQTIEATATAAVEAAAGSLARVFASAGVQHPNGCRRPLRPAFWRR